ncbi:uncharacterized protein LOC143035916 isoform X2 [Oratosquilla oratoria]|uniref:uncharacterized protein LOC143035916 isoform X2 n=1 Tax=Oratosquilla oratoria TaxID=337810 RepID=UPI003F762DC3
MSLMMEEKRKLRVKKGSKLLNKDVSDPNDPEALDPKLEWKPPVVSRGASGYKDAREKNEKKNTAKKAKQQKKAKGADKIEGTVPIKKPAVNRKKRSKAGSTVGSKTTPTKGEEKSTQPDGEEVKDEQIGPVRCVMCPRIFQSLKEMQAHYLSTHKSKRTKDLQTRIDELKNATNHDLNKLEINKSQRLEANEEQPSGSNGDSKCPVCSIAFKSHNEVTAHVNDVHSYVCSECGSVFYNLFLFTSHKCSITGKKVRKTKKQVKACPKNKKTETTNNLPSLENGERKAVPFRLYRPILPKPTAKESSAVGIKNTDTESDVKTVIPAVQIPKHNNVQILPAANNSLPLTKSHPTELKDSLLLKLKGIPSPSEEELKSSASQVASSAFAVGCTKSGRQGDVIPKLESELEYNKHSQVTVPESKSLITGGNTLSQSSNSSLNEDMESTEGLPSSGEDLNSGPMSHKQLIEKKIAEITKNPNLSVTWLPSLSFPSQDKKEYLCGRCKVCCISSEEFVDHIKDCLTFSDVSMKLVDYPPKRILRLRREPMVKGFMEVNSNDKYTINPNLIKLLQAVMHKKNGDVECSDSSPVELSHSKGLGHSFADLLEDDCSSEMYENLNTSNHSSESETISGNISEGASTAEKKFDEGEDGFDPCFSQIGGSRVQSANKGPPPMVMIPIAAAGGNTFGRVSNKLLAPQKPGNVRESYTRDENTTASPIGDLLSADDIKMEVEFEMEEVAEI